MSLYEAETSWAEVPKGRSDLGPTWKKAEVTGYPAEYYVALPIEDRERNIFKSIMARVCTLNVSG